MPTDERPDLTRADIARGIGPAVELLRLRAGLSRDELAMRASLSRSAVLKIEKAERVPGPRTVELLAAALDVPTDVLLVTAWVAAEDDAAKRAERAKATVAWGIFGEPTAGVRAGALAGLGVIALLGAPVALGAAAALAVGALADDHDKKQREAMAIQRMQVEVQRRAALLTDPERLQELLDKLPETGDNDD